MPCCAPKNSESASMNDLIYVALTVACFAGLLGFAAALSRI
jgi:hypothetical protein